MVSIASRGVVERERARHATSKCQRDRETGNGKDTEDDSCDKPVVFYAWQTYADTSEDEQCGGDILDRHVWLLKMRFSGWTLSQHCVGVNSSSNAGARL